MYETVRAMLGDISASTSVTMSLTTIALFTASGVAIDHYRNENVQEYTPAIMNAVVARLAETTEQDLNAAGRREFLASMPNRDLVIEDISFAEDKDGTIRGSLKGHVEMQLSALFGIADKPVSATAEAFRRNWHRCLITGSLTLDGARLQMNGCSIHVNGPAAPDLASRAAKLGSGGVCVAGMGSAGTRQLAFSCGAAADPYAERAVRADTAGCTTTQARFIGDVTLTPGTYCGGATFDAATNVTFAPGLYVIKDGNWKADGGVWTGKGITFYFADQSGFEFGAAVTAKLSAPQSGDTKGLLFAEAPGLGSSAFVIDDRAGFEMEGVLHLPSRNVTVAGDGRSATQRINGVFASLALRNVNWRLMAYEKRTATKPEKLVQAE